MARIGVVVYHTDALHVGSSGGRELGDIRKVFPNLNISDRNELDVMGVGNPRFGLGQRVEAFRRTSLSVAAAFHVPSVNSIKAIHGIPGIPSISIRPSANGRVTVSAVAIVQQRSPTVTSIVSQRPVTAPQGVIRLFAVSPWYSGARNWPGFNFKIFLLCAKCDDEVDVGEQRSRVVVLRSGARGPGLRMGWTAKVGVTTRPKRANE